MNIHGFIARISFFSANCLVCVFLSAANCVVQQPHSPQARPSGAALRWKIVSKQSECSACSTTYRKSCGKVIIFKNDEGELLYK